MSLRVILIRATLVAICTLLVPSAGLFLVWLLIWRRNDMSVPQKHFLRLMFSISLITLVWFGVLVLPTYMVRTRLGLALFLLVALLWQAVSYWRAAIYVIPWSTLKYIWRLKLADLRTKT